jgi:GntR family transcriptional regulator, arabinose operon transcriptional repressor
MQRSEKKDIPKYLEIVEAIEKSIASGVYKAGKRLPSEVSLVHRFGTSRITVGRALRELAYKGLVVSRRGSGTYVRVENATGLLFGLLIPNFGDTEIFESICRGLTQAPETKAHALLWGNTSVKSGSKEEEAWDLCRQYISRKVSGVFYAPLDQSPASCLANKGIMAALEEAGIPIVLLDRRVQAYSSGGKHDLVGIDNHKTGYIITEHLLKLGCKRVIFLAYPNLAATITSRIAGYWTALLTRNLPVEKEFVQLIDPADQNEVRRIMRDLRPEAFVCGNDKTAGHLMQTLLALGQRIPEDVRIVGVDDIKYATLLPVPLTTARQPCRQIGNVAISTMLERLARPDIPARDILLDCHLIVRGSCGSKRAAPVR